MAWNVSDEVIGVVSGILSCVCFLIYHEVTISNIWFSSPIMILIAAVAGYFLAQTYAVFYDHYSVKSWSLYILYFLGMLVGLSLISVLVFTPEYSSSELLERNGPPPNELILGSLPLTIIWMVLTAALFNYLKTRKFDQFIQSFKPSLIIFLSLGLDVSIVGKVKVEAQHKYIVEKFIFMNILLGFPYMVSFILLQRFQTNNTTVDPLT